MPSDGPNVLGFDTSAAHCAAALLSGDRLVARRSLDMARGQAEALVPLLEDLLQQAGLVWADLARIGVGVGPGNFTGIRISVSLARGLALGLGIPAIGVSTFDALRLGAPDSTAAVTGPRGTAYLAEGGTAPRIVPDNDIPKTAHRLADPADLAEAIARLAADRPPGPSPRPLYLRPADAAPPRDTAPLLLDDA